MLRKNVFGKPEDCSEVLLHACCAPCSSAIVEWLMANGVRPTIFYYNPNIWPREEYEIRKNESKRHAESLGIQWIDGDYDHEEWLEFVRGCGGAVVRGHEDSLSASTDLVPPCPRATEPPKQEEYDVAAEPERGRRCEECFKLRLTATARKARELGIKYFATTLASSRWKSLEQINRAGLIAQETVASDGNLSPLTSHLSPLFWAQNWRKGGLQERRNQLLKEYGFYNQQYCGCEFSAHSVPTKTVLRQQMRKAKQQHEEQLARMSADIVERLAEAILAPSHPRTPVPPVIMAYWPLKDEVEIRPLIEQLVEQGRVVLLPKVVDDETMELRRYTGPDDLQEGAFHIMEPTGEPFTDYDAIDVVLVPGMAFDAAGHRLGRGKGYYDRFLGALVGTDGSRTSHLAPRSSHFAPRTSYLAPRTSHFAPRSSHLAPRIIGVCFPFQRVAKVPTEEHDVVMDEVIS